MDPDNPDDASSSADSPPPTDPPIAPLENSRPSDAIPSEPAPQQHERGGIGAIEPVREPNVIERWLMANAVPMLILVAALSIELILTFVKLPSPHIPTPKDPAAPGMPDMPNLEGLSYSVMKIGIATIVALIAAYACVPELRAWLRKYTPRPLPALRFMDILATYKVGDVSGLAFAIVYYLSGFAERIDSSLSSQLAANLLLRDLSFLVALITLAWLARRRAGGPHGSLGIWPFWTLIGEDRPLWRDMALGAACWPLIFATNMLLVPLGRLLVESAGIHAKSHILFRALNEAASMPPWVLAAFFFSAAIGAPFFEELFFRGMLYNVMRRYTGAVTAAFIAALIFATLHPMGDWLGILFLALVLTWLYDRTGRLVASMTLHATNNGVALIMAYYALKHGDPHRMFSP